MKHRRPPKPKKMKKKYIIKLNNFFESIGDDMYREMSSNPVFMHLAELSNKAPVQTSYAFSEKQAFSQFLARVSNELGYEIDSVRVVYRRLERFIGNCVTEVESKYRKSARGLKQLELKLY